MKRILLTLCAALAVAPVGRSAELPVDEGDDGFSERAQDPVRLAQQDAQALVEDGLKFLAERLRQRGDGSFAGSARSDSPNPAVAKTALGALAFMAAGYTADQGPYVQEVRSMIRWILAHTKTLECDCDRIAHEHEWASIEADGDRISRMHGQGYATWALAMAYGMSFGLRNEQDRIELREKLEAAIHCIELAQTENGGWGYEYRQGTFHEGSVTITVLQALRAAHDAGLRVDRQVIERAVQYIRNSQVNGGPNEGGFRYQLGDPKTSFALTAAAVSALNQTGIYDSKAIELGIEYMQRHDPFTTYKEEPFPGYSRLYATQAYWQFMNLRHFRRYYPRLLEQLKAERNREDGSLHGPEYDQVYFTAIGSLALSVPFGYLPSFQR